MVALGDCSPCLQSARDGIDQKCYKRPMKSLARDIYVCLTRLMLSVWLCTKDEGILLVLSLTRVGRLPLPYHLWHCTCSLPKTYIPNHRFTWKEEDFSAVDGKVDAFDMAAWRCYGRLALALGQAFDDRCSP